MLTGECMFFSMTLLTVLFHARILTSYLVTQPSWGSSVRRCRLEGTGLPDQSPHLGLRTARQHFLFSPRCGLRSGRHSFSLSQHVRHT